MARVTYVHHYYPALYFAILCGAFCVDWMTRKLSPAAQAVIYLTLYATITGLFIAFRDICFGIEGNAADRLSHLRWLESWRMHD